RGRGSRTRRELHPGRALQGVRGPRWAAHHRPAAVLRWRGGQDGHRGPRGVAPVASECPDTQCRFQGGTMRIFAYDRFKPGVTMETIEPMLPEEVANVWRLWKAGIVRENYARADEPGVAIVFELDSVEEAERYTDDFPLTKAGYLEWFFIPLMIP